MKKKSIMLAIALTTVAINAQAAPQINLFPISIKESLKQAEGASMIMQSETVRISQEMRDIEELYTSSKCDQLTTDAGCRELKSQMGNKFMELNGALRSTIPAVQKAVTTAQKQLATSLSKLGHKNTPAQLSTQNHNQMSQHRPDISRVRHPGFSKLTKLFRSMNKAIGGKQTNQFALAADTYQGLTAVKEELALLDTNIKNNELIESIKFNMGDISDEDFDTIASFRKIVMGDELDAGEMQPAYQDDSSPSGYEDRVSKYFD